MSELSPRALCSQMITNVNAVSLAKTALTPHPLAGVDVGATGGGERPSARSAERAQDRRISGVKLMAKYLLLASYSTDGVKGVLKEGGSGRRDAVEKVVADVGGTLEAFYFA